MRIGLRIDVDTFRGTKRGVPALCRILASHSLKATFFFCVGPDNMGRHLKRLVRPRFLLKMLRTGAPGLYGWDILLRGLFWPGPVIGKRLGPVIRAAAGAGHEIGIHAWDHHAWQTRIEKMDGPEIHRHLSMGVAALREITGVQPSCSAAPAWKCTDAALIQKDSFSFRFNSDCRGESIFLPKVGGRLLSQPQIPVTLPTYDEVIGRERGVTDAGYNDFLMGLLRKDGLNVLTIHAEVEGIARAGLFARFLESVLEAGHEIAPLGDLLPEAGAPLRCAVRSGTIPGREGWASLQDVPA